MQHYGRQVDDNWGSVRCTNQKIVFKYNNFSKKFNISGYTSDMTDGKLEIEEVESCLRDLEYIKSIYNYMNNKISARLQLPYKLTKTILILYITH